MLVVRRSGRERKGGKKKGKERIKKKVKSTSLIVDGVELAHLHNPELERGGRSLR